MSTFQYSNVLIVEDDVIAQMTLKAMLTEMGFREVFVTSSKEDALSILSTNSIDLVLLDVFINGSRVGIEVAKAINSKSDLPILFLTGSSDEDTVTAISETANCGVLEKPYDYDLIEERLHATLHQPC